MKVNTFKKIRFSKKKVSSKQTHFDNKLDVSYAKQHTFSKLITVDFAHS